MPITVHNHDVKLFSFPGGERQVVLTPIVEPNPSDDRHVTVDFRGSDDLIDLLLVTDALTNLSVHTESAQYHLNMYYFPYARQDRRANPGEAQSLRLITRFIDGFGYDTIEIWDPHSDVLENLFDKTYAMIKPQHELVQEILEQANYSPKNLCIVAPDAGALKKIYKSAALIEHQNLLVGQKIRDTKTGEITTTQIPNMGRADRYLIIDDICDGGRTFIELAKVIKETYPLVPIDLYVTHGIFSKGLEPLLEYFDMIFCPNILNDNIAPQDRLITL